MLQNAPDEFDSVYLQPGVAKMTSTVDTKLQNAVSFTINLEDHTMGQLLWAQLLTDPTVVRRTRNQWRARTLCVLLISCGAQLFAGYKVPHPLEHKIVVKARGIAHTRGRARELTLPIFPSVCVLRPCAD